MIDYHFKLINITDYELIFYLKAEKRLFDKIFMGSINKLKRMGKNADVDLDKIDKFEVLPRFNALIHTAVIKKINEMKKRLKPRGLELLNSKCQKATFIKQSAGNWDIKIEIVGQYVDKR